MYMAEGRNILPNKNANRSKYRNKKDIANETTTHIEMDDRNG